MKKKICKFLMGILMMGFAGIAMAQPKITFSEICYKAERSHNLKEEDRAPEDWFEIWNYGPVPVDVSGWIVQGEKFQEIFIIPQGTIMQPDDRLVFARYDDLFKEVFPDVPFLGPFNFRLRGAGQPIRIYDNNNILHQEVIYSRILPWPKSPDGYGKTLELLDPEGDINDGANWFAGCVLGSPGKPYTPCDVDIVFSEICSSSIPPYDAGDWIEIRNISNTAKDLSNWNFRNRRDTVDFHFPPNTILGPGENLVLARRRKFDDYYPFVKFLGPFEFGIRSHRELLRLYDENGRIYNSMFFHNEEPWPVIANNTEPRTLEVIDEKQLPCLATNWKDGCIGGSPGEYYPNCKFTSTNNVKFTEVHRVYPNPFSIQTKIEASANLFKSGNDVQFQVYDYTGKLTSINKTFRWNEIEPGGAENIKISFQRDNLPPGIYLYRLIQANNVISSGKMMIVD